MENHNQDETSRGRPTLRQDDYRLARQHGITPGAAQTLFSVLRHYPATHKQLAIDCGVTSSAITGTVDKLVAAGWVVRREKPHDRRGMHVHPTELALEIFSPSPTP